MDKVKDVVTGGAYDKPAKTKDGAFTTQDSEDAHTIEGTSADPNSTGSSAGDKMQEAEGKAQQKTEESKQKAGEATDKASETKQRADETPLKQKAEEKAS